MAPARIFMVAAEPSGDVLSREVIEHLRALEPDIEIAAIGGDETAKAGLTSPIDISPLSILGLFEGLKAYGDVVKLADAAADAIIEFAPEAVVLVDSWGFMLRVAQRIRTRAPHIKLIKLVGPQVWATRAGRARTLAATVDHLICIHAMEEAYYQPHGLPITVMGNPALSRTDPGDRAGFRAQIGLGDKDELLLVLPGSRLSEVKNVAPALVGAARLIKQARPNTTILFAPSPSIKTAFLEAFKDISDWALVLDPDANSYDAMAAADLALACSGTVTSELAVQGTPFLVAYKVGWITWFIAKNFLYRPTHITLLNIAADDTEIAPEFLQAGLKPEALADKALALLNDPSALAAQRDEQNKALTRMGEGLGNAPDIAARTILEVISDL
ncbi:MAG: lipid-A-disaccharide synthase [Henriciella sp.]